MSKTVFHGADTRGHADHGWLNARHSFSFAGYHDPTRVHFGALRVLNDDIVKGGMGFGKHPHDNMEIITIVLDGALEHKDSMGTAQALHPNEVQVMSAGSGLTHSEYNHHRDKDLNLLQIWIFPDKKNIAPRYGQQVFDAAARIDTLQTLVSPIDKDDEGLKMQQDAWIYRSSLGTGKELQVKAHSDAHSFYIFLIDGAVKANEQALGKRDAAGFSQTEVVTITATADSDVLILEVPA